MEKNTNFAKINTNVSNSRQKQIDYWTKRAEQNYLLGEKDALRVARHLKNVYKEATKEISEKINSFYGKYASETGMTLDEAKRILNKTELKDFKSYIDKMIKMGKKENFSQQEMIEFKRLYNKAKITRLDELQANIRGELDKLASTIDTEIGNLLYDTYETNYYKTVFDMEYFKGFSSSFSSLNTEAIKKAVNTKYLAANYSTYSDGIWKSTNNLMNILTKEIPRGIVLGYNPRKLTSDIVSKRIDKTLYNNTVRLIRTEYGRILNDATLAGYKTTGIESYKILAALDLKTCDDCGEFDSKIVPISDGEPGINLPPFHPNCRCTTIPYFEPDEFDNPEELIYNTKLGKLIPKNLTYKEWKENLSQSRDGKTHYKGGE